MEMLLQMAQFSEDLVLSKTRFSLLKFIFIINKLSCIAQDPTVGDKIKFPLPTQKVVCRYKAAKQVPQTSDFLHKSRLQLCVKSP